MAGTWDYIVVGAGSAGCVPAERLRADGRSRALVLAAGGENDSFWVTLPKGVAKLVTNLTGFENRLFAIIQTVSERRAACHLLSEI